MRALLPLLLLFALVGCATPDAVPEPNWYRLAEPASLRVDRPLDVAVAIDGFRAEGIHGEQSLVYADQPQALRLHQYNYHLWSEPPAQMLQRRLARSLREAAAAPMVTERLADRREGLRISGSLLALERIDHGDHWQVRLRMELRVLAADGSRPPLVLHIEEQQRADGMQIEDSVRTLSVLSDQLMQAFFDAVLVWYYG